MTKDTKLCSVSGCDRSALARGWCNRHYLRWKAHGDPSFERPAVCAIDGCDKPVEARGWCAAHYLRWKRSGDPRGDVELRTPSQAHADTCEVEDCDRAYYAEGLCRLILFLGTHSDNMADMSQKGRGRGGNQPGEANNRAKLTTAQVDEIRSRYPAERQTDLAREYGVSPSTVSRICSNRRWVVPTT